MKKLLSLTLTILLLFSLAACGGQDSDTNPSAEPPVTPPGGSQQTPDPANPSSDIPNNGTPADLPAPFESHEGDKGYFYPDGDDYLAVMYDALYDTSRSELQNYNGVTTYELLSFQDGQIDTMKTKWAFSSETDAQDFVEGIGGFEAVGNVVYELSTMRAFMDTDKRSVTQWAYDRFVTGAGGQAYMSKPEGFEDVVQSVGSGGGIVRGMTLGEAYTDAGMTVPDDADFLDFDTLDYMLTIRPKDGEKQISEVFLYNGNAMILTAMLTYYDDPADASAYDQDAAGNFSYHLMEVEMPDARQDHLRQAVDWISYGKDRKSVV